jgi:glyoxylase-like metal-dependent hydrolase (beta-lactamase superfamily II)
MISYQQVASGPGDLRIYRIDAEPERIATPGGSLDPLSLLFEAVPTATTRKLLSEFNEASAPVSASSLRVACHIVSTPDKVLVVDSTFPTTASDIFPRVLEELSVKEGRVLGGRPIELLYTHAHVDHAGGRAAVEGMGPDVHTLAHPYTAALFPVLGRPDQMFRSDGHFLRDCGITKSLDEMAEEFQAMRDRFLDSLPADVDLTLFRGKGDAPLRVDFFIEPTDRDEVHLLDGHAKVLRFDGHIPGHLCVSIDGAHLITGDMWLPATTSTVTPARRAGSVGVPKDACGVRRYVESSARLLSLVVDHYRSYPSHENIFENPKRMAMRDLESFAKRLELVSRVLLEHRRSPMRVLDLAWGGTESHGIWKVHRSKYRLFMAHDEATAYVEDLLTVGDLREVEPERYLWTGRSALKGEVDSTLHSARQKFGHLEYRDRGAVVGSGSTSPA